MPSLADTTIRLLGQEPLAGRVPAAEQLRLAEILDRAGFAYLEVSGGGCFDAAVKRGVESPWERIRALKARVKTPLGLALRGRFLVGSRPVDADFARRFVASAAENGIDVFRLHDPLNDVSNLREAAEAIVAAERDFEAGLVYSPGPHRRDRDADRARADAARARRGARPPPRSDRLAAAAHRGGARPCARRRERPAGRDLRPGGGRQRPRRRARSRPRGRSAHRVRDLSARADPAPGLGRGARGGARRHRSGPRRGHRRAVGGDGSRRRAHRRRARDSAHAAHRRARCAPRPAGERRRRDRPLAAGGERGRPARRGARGARPDPRRDGLAAARVADRPGARARRR